MERYLRSPTANNVPRLLHIGKQSHFLGMLGSLDCIHWRWKNYPTHAYFDMLGSNNNINVLEASHLVSNLAISITPPAHYVMQGKENNMGYYLAHGIYPKWSTLVQTIHNPHEAYRKDVEYAYGVLQSRFAITVVSIHFLRKSDLHNMMNACIIMYNMIVKEERNLNAPIQDAMEVSTLNVEITVNEIPDFKNFSPDIDKSWIKRFILYFEMH
ncbi:hypothetical protein Pfo_010122 [Paulownia fortunei]|nr:hypothetical protein Pfo_010122 [Paulownia fortunei]